MGRAFLQGLVAKLPEEYLYGLSRIELKARQATGPFLDLRKPAGEYLRDEKAIVLYSVPLRSELESIPLGLEESLSFWFADVHEEKGQTIVIWPSKSHLTLWFWMTVFHHEVGHHYRNQYRRKRKRAYWTEEEMVATLHGGRLTGKTVKKLADQKPRGVERDELGSGIKNPAMRIRARKRRLSRPISLCAAVLERPDSSQQLPRECPLSDTSPHSPSRPISPFRSQSPVGRPWSEPVYQRSPRSSAEPLPRP